MSERNTTNYNLPKPHPENAVSEDVYLLQAALDAIDEILHTISLALVKKAEDGHKHNLADINELEDKLREFRRKDEAIKLQDLDDVLDAETAQLNYVLTKSTLGYAFRSALSVLGEHEHPLANIVGLQDVLNSLVSGTVGSLDGEIPVFQGTSGKALKRGGVQLASLLIKHAATGLVPMSSLPHLIGSDGRGYIMLCNDLSDSNILGSIRLYADGTFAYAHNGVERFKVSPSGEMSVVSIPATLVGSGTFADARIPNLNASKVNAGIFAEARIPKNVGIASGGQSWQDVTSQRSANTAYRNTTGRAILVAAAFNNSVHNIKYQVSTNGTTWVTVLNVRYSCMVPVEHNQYYRFTYEPNEWRELR